MSFQTYLDNIKAKTGKGPEDFRRQLGKKKAKRQNPEFPKLGAPALRALANAGINRLNDLTRWTEADLLRLHGIGPSAIPKLRHALNEAKLQFRESKPEGKK